MSCKNVELLVPPEVKIQRCTVHKLRNIARYCPQALQARIRPV